MKNGKHDIRAELLGRRRSLATSDRRAASMAVLKQVRDETDWAEVRTVHIYHSLPSLGEIDTQPIIDWLVREHSLATVTIGDVTPTAAFPAETYDVIFVPVLAFDSEGHRLGMGGGWYDRWLATQPGAFKIGLAYEWSEIDALPREPHDIPLDRIIAG